MKVIQYGRSSLSVSLSDEEVRLLGAALNETCNGVLDLDDDAEFAMRLGTPRSEAQNLLGELREAYDRARRLPE